MKGGRFSRALTGLAAGAMLGAALLAVFTLGLHAGLPNPAYAMFEWLTRVLPGRLVIFGLETTLRVLEDLGLSIKNTSKVTEEALALTGLLATSALAGLLFFLLLPRGRSGLRVRRAGELVGGAAGVVLFVMVLVEDKPATLNAKVLDAAWVVGLLLVWGWTLGRLHEAVYPGGVAAAPPAAAAPAEGRRAAAPARPAAVPPAEAARIDRRHFLVRMGGLVATVVVLGAEVADILSVESGPHVAPLVRAPIPFPNAGSPVKPVPGTRPEYTPVPDHYRVDIDLQPPSIDGATWRLKIGGLVAQPLTLSLAQLKQGYAARQQFITLECISNPVGGPLIGTTLWTGPSFRDVLAGARPLPGARWAHLLAQDGYDEVVDLASIQADPRILLCYAWNGQPLPAAHGYPLRVYVPDVYGMKQPKWIVQIVLVPDFIPGYWVTRGWDATARRRTTSVIDTVATSDLIHRGGQTYVPVGGIADAGSRGISRVEVQVDGGPWQAAELRPPLSGLSWTIWRYEWPWREGEHVFGVRAYDGRGVLQESAQNPPYPRGATGIDTMSASIVPG